MEVMRSMSRGTKHIRYHAVEIAGGVVKTKEDAAKLLRAPDVTAELGSITTEPLSGNGGQDYYALYTNTSTGPRLIAAANSIGLTNPGMIYVEKHFPPIIAAYREQGKELPINVAGDSVADVLSLVRRAMTCGFKRITINLACPNRDGHSLICMETATVTTLMTALANYSVFDDVYLFIKVALGMERSILLHNVNAVGHSPVVTGIIVGNTIGGARLTRADGTLGINTANGRTEGGLSGPAILGQALEDTLFARVRMPGKKLVIGCGGVQSAADAYALMRMGADAVQMHTSYREANEDPGYIIGMLDNLYEYPRLESTFHHG